MPSKNPGSGRPRKQPSPPRKKQAKTPAKKAAPEAGRRKPTNLGLSPAVSAPIATLFDQPEGQLAQFNGVLFIANNQSSLNGTLLLLEGISDFATAVSAAAQALTNQGFQSGQSIVVTGRSAVVHLAEHPITVIVMTGARANG